MKHLAWMALLVLVAGCSGEEKGQYGGRVIVYSPHGRDVLRDYERLFEENYPGVDVQWFDMGSQEIYSRVSAERNRPQADIWWGAPVSMFTQAAREGLLEPYEPTWESAVPPETHDPQHRWYAVYRSPLAIIYNERGLRPEEAPQTWDDLLNPKWKGRITLRKPGPSGTLRTFIGAMIMRAPSEDAGFDWLRQLHEATESYMENPQLLYDHMKRNPELITVWLMPDIALQRDRHGYPFGWIIPKPTPVVMEGIAIIKGGPNQEWARLFYEFVTKPESLAHQAKAYWKRPARPDIPPDMLPEWIADQDIEAMPIEWDLFAENEARWVQRWEEEVYRAE